MKSFVDFGEEEKPPVASESEDERHEIRIWIDNYDDIFSDFDPRAYSERNISDDFLIEVKKVSRESDYEVDHLRLLVPEKVRNAEKEKVITHRLHAHFKKNHKRYSEQTKKENRKYLAFTLSGMIIMVCASYLSYVESQSFLKHSLIILLEPAGWFLVWVGLDHLIFSRAEKKPELEFYRKLLKSEIVFMSIAS